MADLQHIPVTIRSFQPSDCEACRQLYAEGSVNGNSLAPNDTGADMDDIARAYMKYPGSHFWVAENQQGEVVGMIGVQQHAPDEGEIRRLRVRRDHRRRGIGAALLEQAIRFCREREYLKLVLDTYLDREPALRLFEKFRFHLSRQRNVHDRTLLYFYMDLYSGDRPPPPKVS